MKARRIVREVIRRTEPTFACVMFGWFSDRTFTWIVHRQPVVSILAMAALSILTEIRAYVLLTELNRPR